MLSSPRCAALLALLALPLAGCSGPAMDLQGSARLDALLPAEDAYPEGYTVKTGDVDKVGEEEGTSDSLARVRPPHCKVVLGKDRPDQVPEGAVKGATQTATPGELSDTDTSYVYVLAAGDFSGDTQDTGSMDRAIDACSDFTGYIEGEEMEGTIRPFSSDEFPQGGGGFAMEFTGGGVQMSMRAAWGEVSETYFSLAAISTDDGSPAVSHSEMADACREESQGEDGAIDGYGMSSCFDDYLAQAESAASEERLEEFEEIMSAAVERLEQEA